LWAHSEYLRLLRSSHDGKVFDQIPEIVAVSRWRGGQQSGVLAAKASDSTSNEGAHASHLCG
jgi:hypothetical protein